MIKKALSSYLVFVNKPKMHFTDPRVNYTTALFVIN